MACLSRGELQSLFVKTNPVLLAITLNSIPTSSSKWSLSLLYFLSSKCYFLQNVLISITAITPLTLQGGNLLNWKAQHKY